MQLGNFPAIGLLPFSGGVRATVPSGMYLTQYQSLCSGSYFCVERYMTVTAINVFWSLP